MQGNYTIVYGELVDFMQLRKSFEKNIGELKSRHKSAVETVAEQLGGRYSNILTIHL